MATEPEIQRGQEAGRRNRRVNQNEYRGEPENVFYERRSNGFLSRLLVGWELRQPVLLRLRTLQQDVVVGFVPANFLLYGQAKPERDQHAQEPGQPPACVSQN